MDKLKNAFSTNFSLNIENEIFHENLKMFIVNNDHFNYIEFLNQQRDKLYDGSNNENSIHLNEALFLFITYFMEIENAKNTIQIQNFMEKIIKENAFFSYPM